MLFAQFFRRGREAPAPEMIELDERFNEEAHHVHAREHAARNGYAAYQLFQGESRTRCIAVGVVRFVRQTVKEVPHV